MNNIETAIPFLEQLEKLLKDKKNLLDSELQTVGIKGVAIDKSIEQIHEQIVSANNRYTIAFVGTFKTGKSTIINSLLNLQGEERLSSEFDPDTAKCIRLMKKEHRQGYDAEIVYMDDKYQTERMSWTQAKRYTSQVALDNDTSLREKASYIEEVRYYVDSPFLNVCNILDLPGTGTGGHSADHDVVTDRKIMEADCIFWVVSTDAEPDKQTILNLEKFSTKMLPIINVWQKESENIFSVLQPEEIKEMLESQFSAYLASAEDPVIYYAGEIDLAQQEHRELKEEWGKSSFTDKVENLLANIQTSERMQRMKKNTTVALSYCEAVLNAVLEDKQFAVLAETEKKESLDIRLARQKLENSKTKARSDIRNHVKKTGDEIVQRLIDASNAFIDNQMQGTNWNAISRRKKYKEELKRDFERNYIRFDSGWLDDKMRLFSDDIVQILRGIYIDFSLEVDSVGENVKFSLADDSLSGFIGDMANTISKDLSEKMMAPMIALLSGTIMMLIPGSLILEAFSTLVASGISSIKNFSNDEKLISKKDNVKSSARSQILQQKCTIESKLSEEGYKVNASFYNNIEEKLNSRLNANQERIQRLQKLESDIKEILQIISDSQKELSQI